MTIHKSERTVRDAEARRLRENGLTSAVASTLANAIFAKGRRRSVCVAALLGVAAVGGASPLPAFDAPVRDEPVRVAPVRVAPVRVEPVRDEPVRVAPVRVEPVRVAPVVSDSEESTASAEGQTDAEKTIYLYRMEPTGATITGVRDRTATTLVVPETIDGVKVTKIAASAFEGMRTLESLTWKSSAECEIGARAFVACLALKQVELPDGLAAIPERAFSGCASLETIVGGKNVRAIGERAFNGCSSLETLRLDDVVSVGNGAFSGCDKLTKFDFVTPENDALQLVDGLLLSKDGKTLYACPPARGGEVVVPDGVVTIAKSAFYGGAVESVVLPQTLEIIDASAFNFCNALKSVVGAPQALETIGASAFANCRRLERFDWPENLQVIGNGAFNSCTSLTSAQIKSARRVGERAFWNCAKLTTLELPSETREIGANAFELTALKSLRLPRDLETLRPGALFEVPLEKIEIEEGNVAFKTVDGALLSADGKTLYYRVPAAPETTWKIPDGVRVVARGALNNNKSLVSVEIPASVETIGQDAFRGCASLQKLTIPASVREIDDNFFGCESLVTFEVAEDNPSYRSDFGSLLSKDGKTLYHCGGLSWNRRVVPNGVERIAPFSCDGAQSSVEIAPTVKRVDAGAFGTSPNLTAIKIPASVERIDERFLNCKNLTTFEVAPENPAYKSERGALLSKDGKTFYRLVAKPVSDKSRHLGTLNAEGDGVEYFVPEGVQTIVGGAFSQCEEITKIVLPKSLKRIERLAFHGALGLKSVSIPAGVTTIEPGAFYGCWLREVVLESSKAKFAPEAFALGGSVLGDAPTIRVDEEVIAREKAEFAARKALEEAFLWGRHERGSATITGVRNRSAQTLEIPETIDGLPVQSIATEAFAGMPALKTVRIPASMQTIEAQAFENCRSLEKIEFATPSKSRLRTIEKNAFRGCAALKTFEAPDFLREIGGYAFDGCVALETVKLGNGAARIGDSAFKNCLALRSVEISEDEYAYDSLYIDRDAFAGCNALLEFAAPKRLMGIHGQAFGPRGERATPIKFALHPESKLKNAGGLIVSQDGKTLLAYFGDGNEELVIPEGVEWIGLSFKNAPITSVRLPKSLRRIGASIFSDCEKLERVEIPEDALLESIETGAFRNCKALKSFAWPKSLKSIEGGAFNGCESLESFVGATGVEKIGNSAFCDCFSLATIELGSGLLEIGESAFAETAAKSINIPASVRSVGAAAFASGELETLEVEEGNEAVEVVDGALLSKDGQTLYRLFAGLEPKSYKIPDGVLVIKRAALGGNATLEELTIPESVTTIEHNAFYRCSSLKKIRIPAKVVDLNLYAFTHCDSLESFEVAPENPKFKSENGALLSKDGKTFYKIVAVERDPSAAPYVLPPTEADDQQRETAAYKNPIYRVPDGVETIAADAFSDMWRTRNAFTEIVLPESLKTIQRTAFQHCSRLETLRVPASVETIGSAAFARCYALKTFEIDPENPAYYVADGTLVSKKGKTVCDIILDQKRTVWKIPEGVERLDATWVTVRFDIPEIVLPESLTQIGADSLAKSRNLTKITIPKNVREVEKGAFAMCPKLEEVVLKSANTKIKDDAFVSSVPNPFEPPTPANVKIRVEPDEEDAAESAQPAESAESAQTAESAESTQTGDAANVDGGTTYDEAAKKFDVRIVDGEATILGTRLQEPTLKIPERIDGSPVTKIAPKAFANNEFVKEIVLPSTLREIGADAFFECVALEKISPLPAGLSFDCVRNLRFFTGCDALQGVSVDPNNQYFKDVDGVLFDKTGTTIYFYPRVRTDEFYQVPDGVQRIGDLAFAGNLHIKRVKFPWTLRMIDTSAFGGCRSLEAAEFFPVVNSLRTIAYGAFSGCDALKSINLPDGLLRVRTNAFHCRSLEKVEFYPVTIDAEEARATLLSENANVAGTLGEKSGMNIETGAFKTPNLKSFELPETLVELQAGAIQTGLENLRTGVDVDAAERNRDKLVFKLPRNMKAFSPGAFNGAVNLQAFEVDPADERWSTVDGVLLSKDGKTLYCYPGARDGLEYDVPEGVETIETSAFSGSGLHKIRTPKTLRKIASGAFKECRSLKTLEIAEGVVEMGGGFANCTQLETLKLPATLSNDELFTEKSLASYCYNLKTIEIAPESAAFKTVDGAVLSKDGKTLYWVPERQSLTEYVVPDGVETIAANAFSRFMRLEKIRLPNGLKTIARNAFSDCHRLTTITIPASVVEIDPTAFSENVSAITFNVEEGNATFKFVDGALVKQDGEKVYEPPRTLRVSVPL